MDCGSGETKQTTDWLNKMQVVIIAGGLATRLGSITKDTPKSMIDVLGKPFIEYQIDLLKKGGVDDIVLCVGYLGGKIEERIGNGQKVGVKITYSCEEKLLGTAGAIKKAGKYLNDVFFTLYGDSYVFVNFADVESYFRAKGKLSLMTVYKNHNQYDKSNTAIEAGLVKLYSKQQKTQDMVYIDYGVNLFNKKILDMIPKDEPYALEQLFPRLIEKQTMLSYEVTQRFYEIGSVQGLNEFREYARSLN